MMWFHPVLQIACLFFAAYVLYLGYDRFLALHRGVKRPFAWKRHVKFGIAVMSTWMIGLGLGAGVAYANWNMLMITGWHYRVAMLMAPLLAFGLASGFVLDRVKKKRAVLPLAHGLNNAVLVALTVWQLVTGIGVIKDFMLP